jgi:hypothetical protein
MKTTTMYSIKGELNPAMLVDRVENPPVPSVEKVWHTASKVVIPASRSATI